MKTGAFESQREQRWKEIEEILDAAEAGRADPRVVEVPRRFREACSDLALAQARIYRLPLIERLNRLVIRCQQFVYRRRSRIGWEPVVRIRGRRVSGGGALRVAVVLVVQRDVLAAVPRDDAGGGRQPDLGPGGVRAGGDGVDGLDVRRAASRRSSTCGSEYGSNFMMFCFYIQNNIGIDFKIFAGGIAACLGTIFFLVLQRGLSRGGGGLRERGRESGVVLDLCQRSFVVGVDRNGGGRDGGDAAGAGGAEPGAPEARRGDPRRRRSGRCRCSTVRR